LAASRGARVTSYEPNPEAFAHLVHNTRSWGVDCRQAAVVGSPQESATLYLHPSRDARSSLFPREIGKAATPLTDGVEVPTVTVDHALAEPCDLLKIDCEGGEFDIFANGTEALGNAKRIIGEVHQLVGDPQQALADLDAAGFEASLHGDPDESFAFLTATRR
jgi:FkbM family methyltransferase